MDVILQAFGTERVVYGSDWPVCLVAADYTSQLSIITEFIDSLSETEQSNILGLNAVRFYNLK